MSKFVQKRLSTIFEPPDLEVAGATVSKAEIEFFVENGFLFKRGVLDPTEADAAMDRVWDGLFEALAPAEKSGWMLKRDDPSTWRDPQWGTVPPADKSGPFERRQRTAVHGRTVKLHEAGARKFVIDLVPNNERIRGIARAMLADNLKISERTRGIYAIFPPRRLSEAEAESKISGEYLGPHTDQVCQQLNVCAYLDDVPPRCGGFTVYPGSHRVMFRAHKYESNWSPNDSFGDAMREVVNSITPVEFVGNKGDVMFWHGRTAHTAGIHVGGAIRWAVFADFTESRDVLNSDEHRAVGQFEWFKDTKLFKVDQQIGDDMWRNWRIDGTRYSR